MIKLDNIDSNILIKDIKLHVQNPALQKFFIIDSIISKSGERCISQYFLDNEVNNVIIYGAGSVGKSLYNTLALYCNVNIVGIADKNTNNIYNLGNVKIQEINNINKDTLYASLVIVTIIEHYNSIRKDLLDLEINNIVSIEDILNSPFNKALSPFLI